MGEEVRAGGDRWPPSLTSLVPPPQQQRAALGPPPHLAREGLPPHATGRGQRAGMPPTARIASRRRRLGGADRAPGGPVRPVVVAARRAGGGGDAGGGLQEPLGAAGAAQLLRRGGGGGIEGWAPRVAEGIAPGAGGGGRAPGAARCWRLPETSLGLAVV